MLILYIYNYIVVHIHNFNLCFPKFQEKTQPFLCVPSTFPPQVSFSVANILTSGNYSFLLSVSACTKSTA